MKRNYMKYEIFFTLMLFIALAIVSSKISKAETIINNTMENATPIAIGQSLTDTLHGLSQAEDTYYYKLTIPNNVGNQWVTFSVTNYASSRISMALLNEQGTSLKSVSPNRNNSRSFLTRIDGAGSSSTSLLKLTAGNTYYIRVRSYTGGTIQGDYVISLAGRSDDNWGTYEKAEQIHLNQNKAGKIEYSDDIDCYYVTLPKDGRKYTFILSSNNKTTALFANSNGVKISSTTIYTNTTNNSFTVTGKGQKIFIRMESPYDNVSYNIKVVSEKSIISTLKLTKYKKGSKKIVGKTIKSATVKIVVNKKTYTVKSNKKGNFTVKLKKKLKSRQKIKVTVSKTNYKKKTQTFKVK